MAVTAPPPARRLPVAPDAELVWDPEGALHLGQTLGVLGRGSADPLVRVAAPDAVWVTARTPAGPVTALLCTSPWFSYVCCSVQRRQTR